MHFEENQLSRGLISLSLRPTAHPNSFQPERVRSSTRFHSRFNLAMGRSPPLRVYPLQHIRPIRTRFRFAYTPKGLKPPQRVTRRLIKQKARHHRPQPALTPCKHTVSGSISLPSQGYFSPFPHGTGSLSVTNEYLALRGGPRRFTRRFTCAVLLRDILGLLLFSVTGLSPSM